MKNYSQEALNLLRLRQCYLHRKLIAGESCRLLELNLINEKINAWYQNEAKKIKFQSQVSEFQENEKVRIYHHELHQKRLKKAAILKLETSDGIIEGHRACADFLEKTVENLLVNPAELNIASQEALLEGVDCVFSEQDNYQLLKLPCKKEIYETLSNANQHAAPGTDGLTSYFYKQCFDVMGDALTDMVRAVFSGNKPTVSQRTSRMVFGCKPKKSKSIKTGDKRRISLFKVPAII